jgi:hypothetical protein
MSSSHIGQYRHHLRWLWPFSISVISFAFYINLGQQARLAKALDQRDSLELLYAPSGQTFELLSLGFKTLSADLLWIRCLQFFSGPERLLRTPAQAKPYVDALLHIDPEFKEAYRWAGSALVVNARGGATNEQVELANSYLKRAMARYPDEYEWPYAIGINYAFWTPSSPQKREMMRVGAQYFERAAQLPGAPKHIPTLIAALIMDDNDPSAMIRFVEQAYLIESDPEIKKMLAVRLQSSGVQDVAERAERRERQRARWHARSFDYLDPGFFLVVGSRMTFSPVQHLASPSAQRAVGE